MRYAVSCAVVVLATLAGNTFAMDRHKQMVTQLLTELNNLNRNLFNHKSLKRHLGEGVVLEKQDSVPMPRALYLAKGALRQPFTHARYELRSNGAWAGLTLTVDERHCISENDLSHLYSVGDGVPLGSDHATERRMVLGYRTEDSLLWISYERLEKKYCAREFILEGEKLAGRRQRPDF